MFHSLVLMSCALAALSVAQGAGPARSKSLPLSLSLSVSVSSSSASASSPGAADPTAAAATTTAQTPSPAPFAGKQLNRCRQSCYQQRSKDWHYCKDFVDCTNCCQKLMAPFELRVLKAQRQESLVLTDIGWDEMIANASRQCLITWEVSGGGLIGNLLTDTARAELSLWPDTVYNIQVMCKHKLTGLMRRSIKLNVDTSQLVGTTTTTTSAPRTQGQPVEQVVEQPVNHPDALKHSQRIRVRPTDRVYIISALPTASELGGVVYPAFGALAFFLALLVMFLFLRPQRKRFPLDADSADTATLIGRSSSSSRNSLDASTLHV
ncbi:transmembrane protein fend [Drosophila teissieri]|uniref:transmembrane protein fend n=1 Tax=Drosophila teissieri TaxID=7243 RepID=UPI001CB9EE37|nr:transmembrane protein fend [Drosophila teissieri]